MSQLYDQLVTQVGCGIGKGMGAVTFEPPGGCWAFSMEIFRGVPIDWAQVALYIRVKVEAGLEGLARHRLAEAAFAQIWSDE